MVGYLAFIAIVNLGLGYGLAVYFRGRSGRSIRDFLLDLISATPTENVVAAPVVEEAFRHNNDDLIAPEATVAAAPVSPPAVKRNGDAPVGLVTLDYVEQLLAQLTAVSDPLENPASVVLVELDPTDSAAGVAEGRLLGGIAKTVRELLAEVHTAARLSEQQLILLLPGDDESIATQRVERVRQRIEATEFLADDTSVQATVSCALAQLSTDYSVSEILASLKETLEEAKRLGGNRTFMYDGMTPSPVVPPELNLALQKCAI